MRNVEFPRLLKEFCEDCGLQGCGATWSDRYVSIYQTTRLHTPEDSKPQPKKLRFLGVRIYFVFHLIKRFQNRNMFQVKVTNCNGFTFYVEHKRFRG